MSNKNKNKRVPRNTRAPSPLMPPPPHPAVESEVDKRQDRRIDLSLIVAVASLVGCLASALFAYWSAQSAEAANKLAQAAQDRAAGKIQAAFELIEETNRDTERMKQFMRKKDRSDQLVFRIENADELMRWSPYVRVKNTGTEPIDAIKTDIQYAFGYAYGFGVQQIEPPPIVINETSTHEATTFGKLLPGQTATIALAPLLLNQISRLSLKPYADKDHFGIFTIRAYCRLVGASSYDRTSEDQTEVLSFHWRPEGFQRDAKHVKELLEKKPWVTID